jgi:hypothetical protein
MTDLIGQLSVEIIGVNHDHLGVTGFSEPGITAVLQVQVDVIEITIESHHAFDDSTLTLAVVLSCTTGACFPFAAAILALFQDIPESSPISTEECRALAIGTDRPGTPVHRHRSTAHHLRAARHRSTAHRPATNRHATGPRLAHHGCAAHPLLPTNSSATKATRHRPVSSGATEFEVSQREFTVGFESFDPEAFRTIPVRHPPLVETTVTLHSVMAVGARLTARIHFLNMSFDPTAISILFVISWMETSITIFVTAIVVTAMFFTILIITTTVCSISLLTTTLRTCSSLSVPCFATIPPLMQLFQFLLDSTDLLMESFQLLDEPLDLWIDLIIAVPSASTLVSSGVMFLGECGRCFHLALSFVNFQA